ncbi:hypothetical protein HKCCE4037_01250 [Rhodobacterales bacterium HKCCE4037]|nr:hypothetical protein [Rhodobacterales bacterium HKCCE4037]
MTRKLIAPAAVTLALTVAQAASAEQFAVQLETAYEGASPRLMETLRITEIEDFSIEDSHFVVIDAPDSAYAEAFILAIGRDAEALHALDADWLNPAMQHLTPAQRLSFLRAVLCDACTS